jgi:hypothetical protein
MAKIQIRNRLRDILNQMYRSGQRNPILVSLCNYEVDANGIDQFNYLDFTLDSADSPNISFLTKSRVEEVGSPGLTTASAFYTSKKRQEARAGKVIGKLFPSIEEKVRTEFVNNLKACALSDRVSVDIYSGEDIKKYYSSKYYHSRAVEGTRLGSSCMRYSDKSSLLDILSDNPQSVELVVAKQHDLVVARALLWNACLVEGNSVKVLDRVYAADGTDHTILTEWMKDKCDYIRKDDLTFKKPNASYGSEDLNLTVPVDRWRYNKYPYLDTFCFIDKTKSCLTNRVPVRSYRTCQDQYGSYKDSDGDYAPYIPPDHVYLAYKGCTRPQEECVEIAGEWYLKTDTITCGACEQPAMPGRCSTVIIDGKSVTACINHFIQYDTPYRRGTRIIIKGMPYIQCVKCAEFHPEGNNNFMENIPICCKCARALPDCSKCGTKIFNNSFYCDLCPEPAKKKRNQSVLPVQIETCANVECDDCGWSGCTCQCEDSSCPDCLCTINFL